MPAVLGKQHFPRLCSKGRLHRGQGREGAQELGTLHLTKPDLLGGGHEVVRRCCRNTAIPLVRWVGHDETPHPLGRGGEGAGRPKRDEVEVLLEALPRRRIQGLAIEVASAKRDQSFKDFVTVEDLVDGHKLILGFACVFQGIRAEPQKLLRASRPAARHRHVLLHFGHGDAQVQLQIQNGPGHEDDEADEGGVLEVGHLQLHGPKLHAPADVVGVFVAQLALVGRRRLPAEGLPVGGLEILPVVDVTAVIQLHTVRKDHERIRCEEMGNVLCEDLVDTSVAKLVQVTCFEDHGKVVKLCGVLADVAVHAVVPRLAQGCRTCPSEALVAGATASAALGGCSVVHGLSDLAPAHIVIANPAAKERRRSRQCQKHWSQRSQLVVEAPRLLDAGCLHGDLEAGGAHAKRHGVGVDVVKGVGFLDGLRHCIGRLHRQRLHILHLWPTDLHLSASALADVSGQGRKSWMRKDGVVGQEEAVQNGASNLSFTNAQEWEGRHSGCHLVRLQGCTQASSSER
mmetsp:Transcript_69480/g.165660  ORF Transcript_69480/g.165660 Transcript_69480/m.165660 type:complete len:514 (+) Transcript_69480:447-1988(+)